MNSDHKTDLEKLGLSPGEAQVYLALLRHGPLAAAAIAHETGIPRTSIYPIVCALAGKGLIEGGLGHGSKFAAMAPEDALVSFVARQKQTVSERERIAKGLGETLGPLAADTKSGLDGTVQMLRTPHVITERWQRCQLESKRSVESFVKAPIFSFSNPAQQKTAKRSLPHRGVYEREVIEDPRVLANLEDWLAGGEESRVYDGELPYKMVIYDRQAVLLTLVRPSGQPSAMFVRHAPFAKSLGILFDYFWQQARPLTAELVHEIGAAAAKKSAVASRKEDQRPNSTVSGNRGRVLTSRSRKRAAV
jgi:sugar-specific transcriptional regulator TrmB